MDYERKRRNVTYHSDSCKMYLRHDFKHKCAYCGVIEEFISLLPETAGKYFEKDHFVPQNNHPPAPHAYSNLYYSCTSCNNKKDAISLPLDPCIHDIYNGEHPHIQGGTPDVEYILTGTTNEGTDYITVLELNSRYHIEIRKNQYAWSLAQAESERIFRDLQEKQALAPDDLQHIANILGLSFSSDPYKRICGGSKHAIDFVEACHYLESNGYKPQIKLEENEMDITAVIGTDTYWGTVRISDTIKECRIKTSDLYERSQKDAAYGIFTFIPATKTMCFHKIDFSAIDWNKKEYRTSAYTFL